MTATRKPPLPDRGRCSLYALLTPEEREALRASGLLSSEPPALEPNGRKPELETREEIARFYSLPPRMLGQRKRKEGDD